MFNKSIAPIGQHEKSPPPSMGHGTRFAVRHAARFAVAEGHPMGPKTGSLKSLIGHHRHGRGLGSSMGWVWLGSDTRIYIFLTIIIIKLTFHRSPLTVLI